MLQKLKSLFSRTPIGASGWMNRKSLGNTICTKFALMPIKKQYKYLGYLKQLLFKKGKIVEEKNKKYNVTAQMSMSRFPNDHFLGFFGINLDVLVVWKRRKSCKIWLFDWKTSVRGISDLNHKTAKITHHKNFLPQSRWKLKISWTYFFKKP